MNYENLRFKQADGSVVTAKAGLACEVSNAEEAEAKPISEMLFFGFESLVESTILGLPFILDVLDQTGNFSLQKNLKGEIYMDAGKFGKIRVYTNMRDAKSALGNLESLTKLRSKDLCPLRVKEDLSRNGIGFEEDGSGVNIRKGPDRTPPTEVRKEEDDAGGNGVQLRLSGTETGLQFCPFQTEVRNEEDIDGKRGPEDDPTFKQNVALPLVDPDGLPMYM